MCSFVFSWAENSEGKMVHVDTVPRGLQCNCVCPYCHERLMARHGDVREHGFAHHSDNRGANLNICYMVILYKLAEQIVKTHKRIHAPSYYGIFPDKDLEFEIVKVDSRYDREDKQPDVIATTKDNKQYLIEFVFDYKVQHKKAIDYKNLNCIEIDLRNQKLETLEKFLLFSTEEKKWLNNYDDFNIQRRLLWVVAIGGIIAVCTRNFVNLGPSNNNIGLDMGLAIGSLAGSALISLICVKAVHWFHVPHHVLSIPSVIPMVPGVLMYRALVALIEMQGVVGELTNAVKFGMGSAITIMCIAIGVAIPNVFARQWIAPSRRKRLQKAIADRKARGKFVDLSEFDAN